MSASDSPARPNTFCVAGMMPVSMYTGSSPATAKLCSRARGRSPSRRAVSLLVIRTAAAPSLMGEELPAVTFQLIWGVALLPRVRPEGRPQAGEDLRGGAGHGVRGYPGHLPLETDRFSMGSTHGPWLRSEETNMSMITNTESGIRIPGTSNHFLDPAGSRDQGQGRLRYLTGGTGAPLIMLHTVRTQAEHFRHVIPLVRQRYTVYALDLPGMGYSQIVPGASYEEPAMRAAVQRLITQLDLHDVILLGESMGAVLALTTAADHPERVQRVVAVNPYDYRGGIARSSLLARLIVTGVLAPGVGPVLAGLEPRPVMRAVLGGGVVDKTALRADYLDELL